MMALDNCYLFPSYQPSLDWDPHTFGVGDVHSHELLMPFAMESPISSETSTGYLQDAVAHWSDRCKRRRTAASPPHEELQELLQNFWDSSSNGDLSNNLISDMVQENCSFLTDEHFNSLLLNKGPNAQPLSSSSSRKEPKSHTHEPKDSSKSSPASLEREISEQCKNNNNNRKKKKKKAAMGVVYPFAVVKPVGLEGDVTLDDINERILMRPARPVRHPVGEFACGPCVSPNGPGLSGKAVVSLTRIQTRGRGTITIIRTRG
ncbi:uncharacterized protein [Typha angustifolia]|uniref:uncharacterized protein n=1 Tax=Typha angustifolia TaxID=59011 RepID=UPI003C30679D